MWIMNVEDTDDSFFFFFYCSSIFFGNERFIDLRFIDLRLFDFSSLLTQLSYCEVTNCSPNPKGIGNEPNKPNTINL